MMITTKMRMMSLIVSRLTLIGERSECKVRSLLYTLSLNSLSNHPLPATATVSSLADLQYLELVRRGEEDDCIFALPVDQQMAAQNIENQLCAEWDRAFAALQANSQAQSLQQPFTTAISQLPSAQSAQSCTTSP
jgi:hypothetical protein